MMRHILPSIVGPLPVLATRKLSEAILPVSARSFRGLATQLPTAD